MTTTSTATPTVPVHYHVTDSFPGYLPESEPRFATDPDDALEAMADLLSEWADANDDTDPADEGDGCDDEVSGALGLAELYRAGSRAPEHADLLAQLDRHRGLAEYVGDRVIEARACHDRECLKYCPERECQTVTEVTDPDLWCWACGTRYTAADDCGWLND